MQPLLRCEKSSCLLVWVSDSSSDASVSIEWRAARDLSRIIESRVSRKWPIAVDLFAGCGGLTLGLKRARFRVVGAVEIDELAVETYRLNHPDVRIVWNTDIREVNGADILEALGIERGGLDLLAGCPPCQGFSSMTTLNGSRSVDDPRNDLVSEYSRLVREISPKALLLENVPGLATNPLMRQLISDVERLGFKTSDAWRVLDTADYGIPQRRRRLVMMAVRNRVVNFAPRETEVTTVRDAISNLKNAGTSGDPLHDVKENRSPRIMELMRAGS